jgi:hypothetical protein
MDPDTAIDPTVAGPFDVCLRCLSPRDDNVAYCRRCGHLDDHIFVNAPAQHHRCANHPSVEASAFCSTCGRPICSSCGEARGYFASVGLPTYLCPSCRDDMQRIAGLFLREAQETGHCVKHRDRPATFICVGCSLPHCDACGYYKLKGFFRNRLGSGPYCLLCFRTATLSSIRKRWVSVLRARRHGWLTG